MREGVAGTVELDGASGEGGGQILRTALALSIITERPFAIRNIRAGRAKPGLRRQHLACVHAAAALCGATVRGDAVGSQELAFAPGAYVGRDLAIDIGSAGSTSLVLQTVLVPAIARGLPLAIAVTGGTHNPQAPPFDFLDRVFAPQLRAMGAVLALRCEQVGFAGDGRDHGALGRVVVEVGAGALRPIELRERGEITARRAIALTSRLPTHVAARELAVVREQLGFAASECEAREVQAGTTGNALLLEVEHAAGRELVTSHGERGLRAETVAARGCAELAAYLAAEVPVGEHLADQLLLPLAVAGGGVFRAAPLSSHALTNIATIGAFLARPIRVDHDARGALVHL